MSSPIDDELLRQQEEEEQERQQQPQPEPEDNQETGAGYNDNGNGKGKGDKDKKHYDYVQKYSETGLLAEAVIIGGIPYFAVAEASNITLKRSISIDDISEYKPFEPSAYLNEPYRFQSEQEFKSYIDRARHETLDTLYRKVKSIWLKYIDADDFHISICAADTIFTYYQDKIGLTHYLFFVGSPGSGKSNNLLVIKYLAYRNFTTTDMTAANIYQFLGSGEEGQGTLCEDEADRIDEDRQKMAIHKNGSIKGFPVARTDTSIGRKQKKYNTFCWKAFAAETFPDVFKAKGFNQRVIELQCSFGNPKYDITEVTSPAGEEEFQDLLNELNDMHNLLLAYRLLHFNEKIPDIKLNIKAREKQLFKPVLRVFQNTEVLNELLPVVSKYVIQKREANYSTLHAFLYRAIIDMIKAQKTLVLESRLVWEYVKAGLQGEDIPGKVLSCETPEFGIIFQKEITQTLEHVFGVKIKKSRGTRKLIFDISKLKRLGNVYDLAPKIEVIEGEGDNGEGKDDGRGEDVADVADVGIGRYIAASTDELEEIGKIPIPERENGPSNGPVDSTHPVHPPHAPHPTPPVGIGIGVGVDIHRIGHTDKFACQNCKKQGDKWFMEDHECSGKGKGGTKEVK